MNSQNRPSCFFFLLIRVLYTFGSLQKNEKNFGKKAASLQIVSRKLQGWKTNAFMNWKIIPLEL